MPQLNLKIDCDIPFRVSIDDQPVSPLFNGTAVVNTTSGDHLLTWLVLGNPGDTFSAEIKEGDTSILTVDTWKIPGSSHGWAGDFARFTA